MKLSPLLYEMLELEDIIRRGTINLFGDIDLRVTNEGYSVDKEFKSALIGKGAYPYETYLEVTHIRAFIDNSDKFIFDYTEDTKFKLVHSSGANIIIESYSIPEKLHTELAQRIEAIINDKEELRKSLALTKKITE